MKTILFITLLLSNLFFCQEYFFIDSLKAGFKVNEYTLETDEIYNVKKDINIYNVFVSKKSILLISQLPDLDEKILPRMNDERGSNWMIIDYEKIKGKIFSNNDIRTLAYKWKTNNSPDKKTLQYKIIKKEKGNYYVSKICLTEFFSIESFKFPFISNYGTINISEQKTSIKEMEHQFTQQFPDKEFIMDVRNDISSQDIEPFSFRNYLSKEFYIKKDKAYQFWTLDGWWIQDGYDQHRGIDRFLYIPEKGIVGGSYDFYFKLKPKNSSNEYYNAPKELLWKNIINEKIMTAKELR